MSTDPSSEELLKRIKNLETENRDLKEKLKAAEALQVKFQTMVDEAVDSVFCKDLDQKYTYVNPSMTRLLGCSKEDLIGKKPEEVFDEPDASIVSDVDRRNLKGEVVDEIRELKIGERAHAFHTIQLPLYDEDQKIIGITGIVRDITEQRAAEKALEQKSSMFRKIASQVPGMIYQFRMAPDGSFSVPYCSENVEDVFGCTQEDIIDDFGPINNVICPDDRDAVLRSINDSARNLSPWECEYRVQIPGEPVKWLYGNSIPERLDDGSIVWSGHTVEITKLKLAEENLRASEEQFRDFFENLTIGVAVYEAVDGGEDFIFYDINAAGQELSKVREEDVRGRRVTEVFPGVGDLGLLQALRDSWSRGTPHHVPFRQYKDDRIMQWVENRTFKLPSGKVAAVYDDRTELMRLEQEARNVQKMEAIGTLAGGLAHDFNNVLNVIMGNISYALSMMGKDNDLSEVMSDMMQGAKQGQDLTQQLLTFAKGGAPIKKVVDINRLLKNTTGFVMSGSKSKCSLEAEEGLWAAEVDAGQINQLVSNLLINADQAMPNGGCISVRTENVELGDDNTIQLPSGIYVKVTVADQGIGIDSECISRIFEPYFTTKQAGSGLGLATAYSVANRHGGHITVCSELGKGTEFSVYLPACRVGNDEESKKLPADHNGEGRILIMDDNSAIVKMAGRIVSLMGYKPSTASDGAEAVEMYREASKAGTPFDFVILDLTVPGGLGGVETISELLQIDPQVRAIVSSGYSNDPVMANYQDYGFCGVVPKPYTKEYLAELLERLS